MPVVLRYQLRQLSIDDIYGGKFLPECKEGCLASSLHVQAKVISTTTTSSSISTARCLLLSSHQISWSPQQKWLYSRQKSSLSTEIHAKPLSRHANLDNSNEFDTLYHWIIMFSIFCYSKLFVILLKSKHYYYFFLCLSLERK